MRRLMIPFAALSLLTAGGPAFAHALLQHAEPAVGATVAAAPAALLLEFSESVEPAFCKIMLTDAHGKPVAVGPAHTDPKDATHLLVALPRLAAGKYTVHSHATSTDTHKTQGAYSFTGAP
ncbi:MAG: copper resistance protein CopC [Alphaproteobacteria bacterium]|nr:copper resistance protein CopC [Alphaproteobacteria bacterium]